MGKFCFLIKSNSINLELRCDDWSCSSHLVTIREKSRESDDTIVKLLNQPWFCLPLGFLLGEENKSFFLWVTLRWLLLLEVEHITK